MISDNNSVFEAALALPAHQRANLAERLLESLEQPDQSTTDDEWLKEAESRLDAYRQGRVQAIPADDVMRSLRFEDSR